MSEDDHRNDRSSDGRYQSAPRDKDYHHSQGGPSQGRRDDYRQDRSQGGRSGDQNGPADEAGRRWRNR